MNSVWSQKIERCFRMAKGKHLSLNDRVVIVPFSTMIALTFSLKLNPQRIRNNMEIERKQTESGHTNGTLSRWKRNSSCV